MRFAALFFLGSLWAVSAQAQYMTLDATESVFFRRFVREGEKITSVQFQPTIATLKDIFREARRTDTSIIYVRANVPSGTPILRLYQGDRSGEASLGSSLLLSTESPMSITFLSSSAAKTERLAALFWLKPTAILDDWYPVPDTIEEINALGISRRPPPPPSTRGVRRPDLVAPSVARRPPRGFDVGRSTAPAPRSPATQGGRSDGLVYVDYVPHACDLIHRQAVLVNTTSRRATATIDVTVSTGAQLQNTRFSMQRTVEPGGRLALGCEQVPTKPFPTNYSFSVSRIE